MRCPFLREAQVRWCVASAFRKMIVRLPSQPNDERCTSSNYETCPVLKQHRQDQPNTGRCPFLQESLVQYCGAASVTKYIPYSESAFSQCGSDSHKYCELYLVIAQPPGSKEGDSVVSESQQGAVHASDQLVEGIRVPGWLWYSPNHMWLDINEDGMLHMGIDAFLATILGAAENLTFLTQRGWCRPAFVFTVHGVDIQMSFPNPVMLTKANAYLRTSPSKVFADPYSVGWLFQGIVEKNALARKSSDYTSGLVTGIAAAEWMRSELKRMTSLIHEIHARPSESGEVLMADGGTIHRNFLRSLDRKEILDLFNEFLPQFSVRRTTP